MKCRLLHFYVSGVKEEEEQEESGGMVDIDALKEGLVMLDMCTFMGVW